MAEKKEGLEAAGVTTGVVYTNKGPMIALDTVGQGPTVMTLTYAEDLFNRLGDMLHMVGYFKDDDEDQMPTIAPSTRSKH